MATVRAWACDECSEVSGYVERFRITTGGRSITVDLCPEHAQTIAYYIDLGRKAKK